MIKKNKIYIYIYILMNQEESKLKRMLHDNHIQSAIISGILFVLVAWPDLFDAVSTLISKIPLVGKNANTSKIITVVLHAVVFSILTYWVNKLLSKKIFNLI